MNPFALKAAFNMLEHGVVPPAMTGTARAAENMLGAGNVAEGLSKAPSLVSVIKGTPMPQTIGEIPSFLTNVLQRSREWYAVADKNQAAIAALTTGWLGAKLMDSGKQEKAAALAEKFKTQEKRASYLAGRYLEKRANPVGAAVGALLGGTTAMATGDREHSLRNAVAGAAAGGLGGYHLGRIAERVATHGLSGDLVAQKDKIQKALAGNSTVDFAANMGLKALTVPALFANPAGIAMAGLMSTGGGTAKFYRKAMRPSAHLVGKIDAHVAKTRPYAQAAGLAGAGGAGVVGGLAASRALGNQEKTSSMFPNDMEMLGGAFGAVSDFAKENPVPVIGTAIGAPLVGSMVSAHRANKMWKQQMANRPIINKSSLGKLGLGAAGLAGAAYLLNRHNTAQKQQETPRA